MHRTATKAAGVGIAAVAVAGILALSGCGASGPTLSVKTQNGVATATLSGSSDTTSHGSLNVKNGQVLEISYDLSSGSATIEILSGGSTFETFDDLSGKGDKTSSPLPAGEVTFRVTGHNGANGTATAKVSGEESDTPVIGGTLDGYQIDPDAEPTYLTLDENGTTITDENGNPVEDGGDGAEGEAAPE